MTELEIFNCNLKLQHLNEKEKEFKKSYNYMSTIFNDYKQYYSYNTHNLPFKILFNVNFKKSFHDINKEIERLNLEKSKLNDELIDLIIFINTSHDLFSYCKKLYFKDEDSLKEYFNEMECDVILLTEELNTLTNKYCFYNKKLNLSSII